MANKNERCLAIMKNFVNSYDIKQGLIDLMVPKLEDSFCLIVSNEDKTFTDMCAANKPKE